MTDQNSAPEQAQTDTMTPMQTMVTGRQGSLAKYKSIVTGDVGLLGLIKYEVIMWLCANRPGALGLVLRKALYKRLLGKCGGGVVFGKNVTLRHPGHIEIGEGTIIDDNVLLDAKGTSPGSRIIIGKHCFVGRNTILSCKGGVIRLADHANIGANCLIQSESLCDLGEGALLASYCYLVAGGNHGTDRVDIPPIQQASFSRGGIKLEAGVWLGARCTVIDGVTVGRDAVAGAGAVVTKNVGPYDVVVGVPAKKVKNRLEEAKAKGQA